MEPITVIAFDLDDTLWPCMPTIHRAEEATYTWLQHNYPRVTDYHDRQSLFEFRRDVMRSHERYQIDLSLMRRVMLERLAIDFAYDPGPMIEEGFELFYRLRHDVEFYDDVFPVLDQLKGRFKLGSISNGNASAGLTPLKDYFDGFINAADVMARKPDPRIFEAFCQKLDVEPGQCLYLGDDPHFDVEGARQSGLRAIWVNREAAIWPGELAPAESEINTLHQLLDLVGAD